jgi:hypothetical protein
MDMADPVAIFRVRQTPLRDLLPRLCPAPAPDGAAPAAPCRAAKVRELLDSMYLGYPIGHVAVIKTARCPAPAGQNSRAPRLAVLDGADMLAGLAEAMLGRERAGGGRVVVAFRPTTETFLVGGTEGNGGAGGRNDPECIPDIAAVFCAGASRYRLVTDYLTRQAQSGPVDAKRQETISRRLDRLTSLAGYPVTVFEFSAGAPEDHVREAVARLRSRGLGLTPVDLALAETGCQRPGLLEELFRFCRAGRRPPERGEPSPFNHILRPSPRDMVASALTAAEHYGRGDGLCDHLGRTLDLVAWHGFVTALAKAGFRGMTLVGSKKAAFAAYGGYLALKHHAVAAARRDRLAGQLYLGLSLAPGRLQAALSRARAPGADKRGDYPQRLEEALDAALGEEFFGRRLPSLLAKPGSKTLAFLAYLAAQARLGAPVLFSTARVGDLMDYGCRSGKKALERHHLHPRNHLQSHGVRDNARIDRPGNLALVEWPDNAAIADLPPQRYVPALRARFAKEHWEAMLRHNALWPGFEHDDYETFLAKRETLMAHIIRQAYLSL